MSAESQIAGFYDEHPINEGEILSKLADEGKHPDRLVPEDLFAHDQDHYGGLEATDSLAALLDLNASSRVLDVCSGMGGTSRYLAWRAWLPGARRGHDRQPGAGRGQSHRHGGPG